MQVLKKVFIFFTKTHKSYIMQKRTYLNVKMLNIITKLKGEQ